MSSPTRKSFRRSNAFLGSPPSPMPTIRKPPVALKAMKVMKPPVALKAMKVMKPPVAMKTMKVMKPPVAMKAMKVMKAVSRC